MGDPPEGKGIEMVAVASAALDAVRESLGETARGQLE